MINLAATLLAFWAQYTKNVQNSPDSDSDEKTAYAFIFSRHGARAPFVKNQYGQHDGKTAPFSLDVGEFLPAEAE